MDYCSREDVTPLTTTQYGLDYNFSLFGSATENIPHELRGGKVKRKDIDALIIPKLSSALTLEKKKNKVTNFLSQLRMDGKIESPAYATWRVSNKIK